MKCKIDKNNDLSLKCKCGKPITITNKYGMFCEDKCGLNESKEAYKKFKQIFKFM